MRPHRGCPRRNFVKMFDAGIAKLEFMGYRMVKKNYNDMLSRFHMVTERNRRTDRHICYINIARQYADAR